MFYKILGARAPAHSLAPTTLTVLEKDKMDIFHIVLQNTGKLGARVSLSPSPICLLPYLYWQCINDKIGIFFIMLCKILGAKAPLAPSLIALTVLTMYK